MISVDILIGFVLFAIATLFTPGPNNIMLMASGLNYGLKGALPHLLGVAFGFGGMVFLVGVGLGTVFNTVPILYPVIKYIGAIYLLYLAWVIATAEPHVDTPTARRKPIGFWQAVAFQWVNPKAWVMAVGAVATYAGVAVYPFNMIIIAGLFALFGLASSWTWVMLGTALRRLLRTPWMVRTFNIAMGVLLVISVIPVILEDWL